MNTDQGNVAAPYVGPRPFEREQAHLFFGRDQEAEILISLTISQRVVVLYSASGLGKSSLLKTKTMPGVQAYGFTVLGTIPYRYSYRPGTSLGNAIALDYGLTGGSLTSVLERLAAKANSTDRVPTFVIVVDQFEEIFADGTAAECFEFFRELRESLEACAPPQSSGTPAGVLFDKCRLRVIIAMREDYIAKLDPFFPMVPELREVRFRLEPLSRGAAIEAVKRPVEAFQTKSRPIRYEPGVAEQIVTQLLKTRNAEGNLVESHAVEPVQLQVVCLDLWNSLPAKLDVIKPEHIPKGWDVDSVLRAFYDDTVEACSHYYKFGRWSHIARAYGKARLRKWFGEKMITSGGTRGTAFREKDNTGGIPNTVIEALLKHYLIRHERRAGGDWYEISHDRLVQPIIESNRIWHERLYQIIAVASVAVVALSIIVFAGMQAVDAIGAASRVSREDVEDSIGLAKLAAPDVGVAVAAVVADKPEAWGFRPRGAATEPRSAVPEQPEGSGLQPRGAARELRSAVFDEPEISLFGRAGSAVTALGKDVDGRPYAITAPRRVHGVSLSGTRLNLEDKQVPPGCADGSMKLVATNGELYLATSDRGVRICEAASAPRDYNDELEQGENLLAAALHPLGRYFAYVACARPCQTARIALVDIAKKAKIKSWTLEPPVRAEPVRTVSDKKDSDKKDSDRTDPDRMPMRDVTALTLGPGLIAVGSCGDRSSGTANHKCAESVVKVFDWDGQQLNAWSVSSPKIRAIALSDHWAAFAYDSPTRRTGAQPGEIHSGRIQLKRVRVAGPEGRFRPPQDARNWASVGGSSDALTFADGERTIISGNDSGLLTVRRVENVPFQGAVMSDGIQQQSNCAADSQCAKLSAGQFLASARKSNEFVSSYATFPEIENVAQSQPLLQHCLSIWTHGKDVTSPDWECRKAPKGFGNWSWRSVSVSDDGNVVAAAGLNGLSQDLGRAWIRDGSGSFKQIAHAQSGSIAAVSADGGRIAWGQDQGHVAIWSLKDGTVNKIWALNPPLSYDCVRPRVGPLSFRVTGLAFAGGMEDQTLVVADSDGCIAGYRILPEDASEQLWTLPATGSIQTGSIQTISLDTTGSWLAAGTVNGDILVWNLNRARSEPLSIRARLPWVGSIVWLKGDKDDSMILAANARWGPVGLWEISLPKSPEKRLDEQVLVPAIWLAGRGTAALATDGNGLFALNVDGRLLEIRPYLNADEAKKDLVHLACTRAAASAFSANETVWTGVLVGTAAGKRAEIEKELKLICAGTPSPTSANVALAPR